MKNDQLARETGRLLDDWRVGIKMPLYKGKGDRAVYCNHMRIIPFSIIGMVYSKIVNDWMRETTEELVGEEHGGFRKGRCVDQVFSFRCIVKSCLEKRMKVFATFTDLKKAYDRLNRRVCIKH